LPFWIKNGHLSIGVTQSSIVYSSVSVLVLG